MMRKAKAAVIECLRAWKQGDADADAILREYGDLLISAAEALPDLTKMGRPPWTPMGFNQLCKGCTDTERMQLARYLALLRMEETLALGQPQKLGGSHDAG